MTSSKGAEEYRLDFLMKSSSLKELLGILSNICVNLDLTYLNPQLKHFRYFQFTFFGLLVKVRSLFERLLFRSAYLGEADERFAALHHQLCALKSLVDESYELVRKRKMKEGAERIEALSREYERLYRTIERALPSLCGVKKHAP